MSNRFKIPYSTAKSLFDELKHSSSDELTEKVLNNWKHRFEDSLKEYIEIFLNNTSTWFTIEDIVKRIKYEFDLLVPKSIIRSWLKTDF